MHISQANIEKHINTFGKFNTKLCGYENTEKYGRGDVNVEGDNVMTACRVTRPQGRVKGEKVDLDDVEHYTCGENGHMARTCSDGEERGMKMGCEES